MTEKYSNVNERLVVGWINHRQTGKQTGGDPTHVQDPHGLPVNSGGLVECLGLEQVVAQLLQLPCALLRGGVDQMAQPKVQTDKGMP